MTFIHTTNKNTEAEVVASKDAGIDVNVDKTKCMIISGDQHARKTTQRHEINLLNGGRVQIFGNDANGSTPHS